MRKSWSRSTGVDTQAPARGPGEHQDHATRLKIAKAIVARYAKFGAISGGLTSLPGVIPGVGTTAAVLGGGLADVVASLKIQVDMCVCLVELFEDDLVAEDRRQLAFYLALTGTVEKFAKEAATPFVTKSFVKMAYKYLAGSTLTLIKGLFARAGIFFTRKALIKAIPFGVSVAVSSATNYALTIFIGNRMISFFEIKSEMDQQGEAFD